VTGLLHDIGKLVLDRYSRDPFTHALRLAQSEKIPLDQAERRRFGSDHAAIAGELLDTWNFPRELSDPIRYHHDPDRCPERHRLHAILIEASDYLCNAHHLGYSGNAYPAAPPEANLELLRIRSEDVESHILALRNEPLLVALLPA
jgi:HD-like signal output (HDOD) protein